MSDPIIISDDVTVQAILTENCLPLPKPEPPFTKSICYLRHTFAGGHLFYCMVSFECGHPNPCDNGYVLMGLPARTFTPAEAAQFFTEAVAMSSHGPIETGAFDRFN